MTWLRIDDAMVDHPKIIGLSDGAFRLHITALCYCARHLTDGTYGAGERSHGTRSAPHRRAGEGGDA